MAAHRVRPPATAVVPLLALAPMALLVLQGRGVRARTPRLPEAAGPRSGLAPADDGGGGTLRLLVLGESTAAGVGVSEQRDGLAGSLARELALRRGVAVAWTVCARTGATAQRTARELLPGAATGQDLAVVVLGVNDTLRLRGARRWSCHIGQVLDGLAPRLAPGGLVVLTGVPDLGAFPLLPQPLRAVLGRRARALDRRLDGLAAARPGLLHVPGPPVTGAAVFAVDGFHPNAEAYAQWASHLAAAVG
ncbi:SGNH/GDSL hydrolase family protein [Modestobacter sp. I12A-02628]|uniref:SGNH/GDSL hydrolase family protein n=1 Tax=Goekera deserti TaxID=2497753 RepID=A0A7K3WGQ7_9ACTN|nr:SGNH/GDSL hydrolase family protein [Goekera deserti]MPQ99375.1 SGNH/GDSL hydrolase family protein [Goekera deserti]NDI48861.1 SGNH/GDSL hydrolase family protein [Goekera deserti]NEL55668.1 SGNH/GDSL hydrolase family protein [Goekera deserti]